MIQLAIAIADYIEQFYNAELMHSSINDLTPNEFHDLQSKETQTRLA
jgi:transposase InsO family protein